MSSSPSIEPGISEPLTGFVGDVGGVGGDKGIFKASDSRIGADLFLGMLVRGSAACLLLMLVALVGVLAVGARKSIHEFGFHFITSSSWQPAHTESADDGSDIDVPGKFGALAFIYGTVVSSALALLLAVPLSLGAALFLIRIGPWLTPTFVKCGILGLFFTTLLIFGGIVAMGNSGVALVVGGLLGVAFSCTLMWVAWRTEDPRVSPHGPLRAFLQIGLPLVVLLLARTGGAGWMATFFWTAAAAVSLEAMGRAGVNILSFLIEFLAAIPSIAYGIWGLFVVVPFLANHVEPYLNSFFGWVPFLRFLHTDGLPTGRDMLAAGVILAIMVLPIITAISRDVLRAVPQIQIEGTQALGATWWQSSWAMLRYGRSGLFGAVMLGLARAAGETMAVTMVIGNQNHINASILEPGQTMSSLLANTFKETSDPIAVSALIELGLVLLIMSLIFNIVARYLVVGTKSRAGGA